ncbi:MULTISPECIES: TraR/DksA C4-type zinc finger protein [Burkholderia]|uniref:TraR/DksA C4-type zinc finger protein n=1 Tax=Burkholderia TaxID=32008 RepID=UPI0005538C3C|nr:MULTISPECIES: TraR/DksA C4-type zinc finger protein [Burkholderia]MCA8194118.1 TraR/DksA C4-type zinc finger protein [Burkholderia vietnamiensis]HDR9101585.1 TraR/DksA C4-type zinc finger protein [Burkholderia vietnamiensis]HDR9256396.1 TraR/DksA C4-type zinc finger protein [Burkholderia vietnamiensis]
MDDFDRASMIEEQTRELAIAAARANAPHGESAFVCQNEECGVPIPEARRVAAPGCRYCIECQSRREAAALKRRGHAIHA